MIKSRMLNQQMAENAIFDYLAEYPDFGKVTAAVELKRFVKFLSHKMLTRVLVASTLASGEGLNLQSCHYCILHERQWNPANEEQTEKRFHRIGQHDVVKAIYMLGQDTIDSLFHTIVERKRQQFHAAMNKGEAVGWTDTGLIKELAQAIVNTARGRRVA